jgi:transposase
VKRAGQSREFWKGLAVEVEQGAKLDEVAQRNQVTKKTLSWWCWRFRFDGELSKKKSRPKTRLLPVVRLDLPATTSPSAMEITVSGTHVRFDVGTDVTYVTALVRALESRC